MLGIIAILAGLILSLVGAGDTSEVVLMAAGRAVFSLLIALVASLVILRVDVVSDGELIDAGRLIEVTRVDGNRIVVWQVTNINAKE